MIGYNFNYVMLSDSQQPKTYARLLINHDDCAEAIKNP